MKALALALFAVLVAHLVMHRGAPQRTAKAAKAWADWFSGHPNGGGV